VSIVIGIKRPNLGTPFRNMRKGKGLSKPQSIHNHTTPIADRLQDISTNFCRHHSVHEIGQDFDKDGRLLRLVRCRGCGLLMRQYIQTL